MIITCGLDGDKRKLNLKLPKSSAKIGIFVSGGIDSAILYYLLLLENKIAKNIHTIVPIVILRKEGSKYFSKPVISAVNQSHGLEPVEPLIMGDTSLPEEEQVKSGVHQAHREGFDLVYVGVIEQLPQHMVNWQPIPHKETDNFKTPFRDLNKSHVIDLVRIFKQEHLFSITHSCAVSEIDRCNICNGCNERSWGFEQLGIVDPGKI
jgi:hypothetical protein